MSMPGLTAWAQGHDLVIVEGCDGTGKTTLAGGLQAHHGYTVVHATPTPQGINLFDKYREILTRHGPMVLDRSFVSELVYGPLERGRSRLSDEQAMRLAGIAAQRSGILAHLTCEPERIIARLLARDGHAPSLQHVRALSAAYEDVCTRLARYVQIISIDTGSDSDEE